MPLVSIIIPTYNRSKYICRAIDSALAQTYPETEIIVIDDGSTDDTPSVLKPYMPKIKYVHQQNGGISAARNRGIKESAGKYIAFLDSDDQWAPQKLAIQVAILEKDPKIGIVHNKLIIVNDAGERVGMKPSRESGRNFKELIEIGGDLPTSSVITRRECFQTAGLFDEHLKVMEDFEMWLRIARTYDVHEVREEGLAFYYRHNQQITQNRVKVYEGTVMLHEKILNEYPEAPRRLTIQRIAENQYMLARAYYDQKEYRPALSHGLRAIARYPMLGSLFFKSDDKPLTKAVKMIKPYGFVCVCALKSVINGT